MNKNTQTSFLRRAATLMLALLLVLSNINMAVFALGDDDSSANGNPSEETTVTSEEAELGGQSTEEDQDSETAEAPAEETGEEDGTDVDTDSESEPAEGEDPSGEPSDESGTETGEDSEGGEDVDPGETPEGGEGEEPVTDSTEGEDSSEDPSEEPGEETGGEEETPAEEPAAGDEETPAEEPIDNGEEEAPVEDPAETPDEPSEEQEEAGEEGENAEEEFLVKITVVDADGKAVKGATLALENSDGEIIKDKEDKEIGKWETVDEEGKEAYELKLPVGSYVLKEISAPAGYKKLEDEIKLEVKEDGKVEIVKEKDEEGNEIESPLSYQKDEEEKDIENELLLLMEKEPVKKAAVAKAPKKAARQGCTPSGSDPYFDIYWLDNKASEETTKTDSAGHSIAVKDTPTSDSSNTLMLQAEFSIGRTSDPIEAGDLQIVLPRYPFTEWDWDKDGTADSHKSAGSPKLGVGQKPAQSGKSFYWYFARYDEETGEYVEDNSGEYVILENYESISNTYNTPITFTVEMTYPYQPSRVDESKTHTINAEYIVKADSYCINKNNESITAQIETGSKMDSVRKTVPTDNAIVQSWDSAWGDFDDTGLTGSSEDYVYARYYIYASVYGADYGYDSDGNRLPNALGLNQPYYLYIDEEKPGADIVEGNNTYKGNNKGKVVAFSTWGTKYSPHTEAWYKDPSRVDQYEIVDGYVVGNKISGSSTTENSGTFDTKTATTRSTGGSFASSNSNSCVVVVAYPKEYSDALRDGTAPYGPNDYLTNTVTVTKRPYNSNDPTETLTASTKTKDVAVEFKYEGNLFRVNKFDYVNGTAYKGTKTTGSSSVTDVKGGKTLLELEQDVTLHTFRIDGYARGYGLTQANPQWAKDDNNQEKEGTIVVSDNYGDYGKQPYKIEIIDDQLYLNGVLLQQGDYEIVSTYYSTTGERYLDPDDYTSKYYSSDMERSKPVIYYQTTLGGQWIEASSGAGTYETVNLPSGAVGVKYEFETKAYVIDPYIYLTVKLKGDSSRVQEALAGSDGEAQITDIASFGVFTEDGQGNRKYWNLAKDDSISSGLRDSIISYEDAYHNLPKYNGENRYYQHDYAYQWLTELDIQTSFTKGLYTSRTDNGALIDYRTYQLHSDQKIYLYVDDPTTLFARDGEGNIVRGELRPATSSTPGENEDAVIYYGQDEVTFYDLLPPAANLDASSLRATYQQRADSRAKDPSTNYTNQVAGEIVEYQTISNYNNSGRTLLIVKVKLPDSAKAENWGIKYDDSTQLLQLGTRVSLYVQLVYPWEDLLFYTQANSDNKRVQRNYGAVWVPNTDDGFADDPAGTKKDGSSTSVVENDLVDALTNLHNGSSDEYDTYYDYRDDSFQPLSASLTGYSKMVKADSEATYRTNSAVQPEENYNYRLRYAVESDTSARNIIIYDVLEHAWEDADYMRVDDFSQKYALTNRYWEGTFDHVDVSALEYLGIAPVIYYSTTDRKTMQDGLNSFSKSTNAAGNNEFANVKNTKYWSKGMTADEINALSDAEKQKITAIAFDCGKDADGQDFILEYQDDGSAVLMAYIHMKAPDQDTVDKDNLVDPEYVYAYNNSFLSAQSKSSTGTWSAGGSKMSDGTTVRICEPNPPIFKLEEDEDEKAGGTSNSDMTDEDTMTLSGRDEVYKYTLTTKVPIMGVDKSGAQEQTTFTIYDTLVNELEFAKINRVKIEIGNPDYSKDGNSYFIFDPDGQYANPDDSTSTYKGFAAIFDGYEDDEKTPKYQMFYFNSLGNLPRGFSYRLTNQNYGNGSTGANADNTISFAMTYSSSDGYDRVNEFMGEKVSITFYAKVREDATLGKYVGNKVPNTAHYTIPNHPGADSNTVYVKLDEPETPNPKKEIATVTADDEGNEVISKENQKFYVVQKSDWSNVLEDGSPVVVNMANDGSLTKEDGSPYELNEAHTIKTAQELKNLDQTVQYTIPAQLPIEHESLMISDRLADALAMDTDSIKINLKGEVTVNELESGNIKTDEEGTPITTTREIDRTFTAEELNYIASRSHGLSFNATAQGFSITFGEDFINRYGDYYVDGEAQSTTSTVTDEEGNESEVTAISSWRSGDYGTTYTNSAKDYAIGGLEITITFNANIKKGADLTDYLTETGVEIPNTANYRFGNNPTQSTDPVVIRPPRDEIEKAVNNKNYQELASKSEPFTYSIDVAIPDTADDPATEDETETEEVTSLVIYDTIEDVLEFFELTPENLIAKITKEDGKLVYTLTTEEKSAGLTVNEEEGTIEFSLDKALADSENKSFAETLTGDQRLRIEFKARIKESVGDEELDKYREEERAEVPNEATYKINDKYEHKSNVVKVTPPSIGKTVNNVQDYYLSDIYEAFEYEITAHMPANDDDESEVTSFALKDTLVDVLGFADVEEYPMSVTIGEAELPAEEVKKLVSIGRVDEETGETVDKQTVTVEFGEGYVDNDDYKKKAISFKFYAKIKEGADLTSYWQADGTFKGIPNTASWVLTFDDDSTQSETSKPVTVTPPDIGKKVNGKTEVTLGNRYEVFTYTISTFVPKPGTDEEITKATLHDTLEDVLEFVDKEETVVKVGGEEVGLDYISYEGEQKIVLDMANYVEEHAGEIVEVIFKAKIKDSVTFEDLAPYINETSEPNIPNKATANITVKNADGEEVEKEPLESEEVTVTPPPIEKKVNGKNHEDLEIETEIFEYSIKTWVPVTDNADEKATSFKVLDTLEDVLEFTDEDVTVTIGDTTLTAAEIAEQVVKEGQDLTVTLTEEQIEANPKALVVVTFTAKIKEGADLSSYEVDGETLIPNKARYQINDDPEVTSNTVTVTPPDVSKTVNDVTDYALENRDEVFTYRISGKIPAPTKDEDGNIVEQISKFEVYDELEEVLELANQDDITVTLGGEDVTEAGYLVVEDGKVSAVIEDADVLLENAGKYLVVVFDAQIKADADLADYIVKDNLSEVPNTAKVMVDDNPDSVKESKPVTVTPPPIEKKVNGKDKEALAKVDEVFTYSITTKVPIAGEDEEITKFDIIDTLEDVLEFADEDAITVAVGETELTAAEIKDQVVIDGQTITLTLTPEQIAEHAKETVIFTFKAAVKDGADLDAYVVDGIPEIPNTAKYVINDDPDRSHESKPVTVTPPTVDKKVNSKKEETLFSRTEAFTYTVDTLIPNDAVKMTITDTIEPVLEFNGDAVVTINGEEVDADVKVSGQTITAVVGEEALKDQVGNKLALEFNANIKKDADLDDYIVDGEVKIPNTAQLNVNDDPDRNYETKPVTVTPPDPKEPPIEKKVNGKEHEDLSSVSEEFLYTIKTTVPEDAKKFVIKDTLEDVLEYVTDTVSVQAGDKTWDAEKIEANVSIEGQVITVTLKDEDAKDNRGEAVTIEFMAAIKDGADLTPYEREEGILIPNKASYNVNDNPLRNKESDEVTVTPPTPEEPEVEKKVNGKTEEKLLDRKEVFTYTITSSIPVDTKKLVVKDVLEDVLELVDEKSITATIDGEDVDATIGYVGQTLTVTVLKDALKDNWNKILEVTFQAKIKDNADLDAYIVDGEAQIPNTAEVVLNDDPNTRKETEPVTVTPPDPNNPPLKKYVNYKEHEDLDETEDVFTYTLITKIPEDAKKFVITDTMEKVLEFADTSATYVKIGDGEWSAEEIAAAVKIDGQKITLTLDKETSIAGRGKLITFEFKAKIREGADLSAYATDEGVKIPNKAKYRVNNNPFRDQESNVVTVTPPEKPIVPGDDDGGDNPPGTDTPKGNEPEGGDKTPDKTPDKVKTGDDSDAAMYILMMLLAIGCAAPLTIAYRRRRR